jgi:alpha-tubulin suppressor-like RCC1 family protein
MRVFVVAVVSMALVAASMFACGSYGDAPAPATFDSSAVGLDGAPDGGPDAQAALTADRVSTIVPGRFGSCVITKDRALWCLGRTQSGELARPVAVTDSKCVGQQGAATTIAWERLPLAAVDKVAVGATSKCILSEGIIRCWGSNNMNQLGHGAGTMGDVSCAAEGFCNVSPQELVGLPSGMRFVDLSAGSSHYCARTALGDVYCWGSHIYGEAGTGAPLGQVLPTKVTLPSSGRARAIASGEAGSCAALEPTGVACWGWNNGGNAGVSLDGGVPLGEACTGPAGRTNCVTAPTLVPGTESMSVREIDTNEIGTCFLSGAYTFCFGSARLRFLGDDRASGLYPPTRLQTIANPQTLSLGQYGALVFSGANVWTWGFNGRGATANGLPTVDDAGTVYALLPEARPALAGASLAALAAHGTGMALRGGELLGWGLNECGQLGHEPNAGDDVCALGVPCRALPVSMLR